ncbi:hypothetical protein ACOSQ4_000220 [Xanthoceras sorbifolium]
MFSHSSLQFVSLPNNNSVTCIVVLASISFVRYVCLCWSILEVYEGPDINIEVNTNLASFSILLARIFRLPNSHYSGVSY